MPWFHSLFFLDFPNCISLFLACFGVEETCIGIFFFSFECESRYFLWLVFFIIIVPKNLRMTECAMILVAVFLLSLDWYFTPNPPLNAKSQWNVQNHFFAHGKQFPPWHGFFQKYTTLNILPLYLKFPNFLSSTSNPNYPLELFLFLPLTSLPWQWFQSNNQRFRAVVCGCIWIVIFLLICISTICFKFSTWRVGCLGFFNIQVFC